MNSLPWIVQFAIGAFMGHILSDACIKYLEKRRLKMTDLISKDYVNIDSIIARNIVRKFIIEHLDKSDPSVNFDVYIVWQCYILGNRKWLISSTLPDKMYYEVTYNNAKKEWYLDAYVKLHNECIADSSFENIKGYFRKGEE